MQALRQKNAKEVDLLMGMFVAPHDDPKDMRSLPSSGLKKGK